jgi:hypothetical protein
MVGKLERVPLRSVFPHEAYDLTRWLAENADVVSDAIGETLTFSITEGNVGTFRADIFGEDESGNLVVVENQLGKSDHDHLGKLITYSAGRDAKIAIWIVADPRPEHVEAINWINQANICRFFLFRLEAVRIGVSEPAPLLTLITGPSPELIRSGEQRKETVERHLERQEFWSALLPVSNTKTPTFRNVSPGPHSYVAGGSGRSGVIYVYRLGRDWMSMELYFDRRDADENDRYFHAMLAHRTAIDQQVGPSLTWDAMEGNKAARLRIDIDGGYRSPMGDRGQIIDAATDAMQRLEQATRPYLKELV